MKRLKISSYFLRTKWAILLVIAIILIVFGRMIESPALTKTGIVLGAGIDFLPETQEFVVTAQNVIMASSSSESGGQTTYSTYTEKGKSISSALDSISRKMGLTLSLSHCNVLILSQETLKLDMIQLIYPLTGLYSLPEHAIVVTADRSPQELIALQVGTTVSTPYYLQLALTNKEGTDGMIRTTVKDLIARTQSRSRATAMPYIAAKLMSDQPIDGTGELKDRYEFEMKQALVFGKDSSRVLDEKLSEVLALYLSQSAFGAINYSFDTGATVDFNILEKDVKVKPKGREVEAQIKMSVELLDVQFIKSDSVLTDADEIILQAASNLGKELAFRITQLFELSKEINIDFLGLQAKVYQSVGRTLEEDCLNTITFTPTVELEVKDMA